MPIKTKFNSYVAPVVQQHMETPKDYSGMVNAVAKLGEVMVKSSEARDDSEVASKLSDYQTKSAMKLKELELNGTKDIEGEFTKWQGDFKAQASDGMSSYALKKFNENLYKVENPMSLRAKESQLNVDAAYQHDYTNTALANNVIGVQADPSSYNSLMQDGYNLINSKNSMLSIPQRINAFNEYRYKLTTNKAMGDYASGVGINDIIKNIGNGAYNVELEDKTVVSLDKAQNQALAKTMVTDDFNKRLMTDPKSLKADVDAGKFPWKVKGIGELYNADDKASMMAKLDKAVKEQQVTIDDMIKQEENDLWSKALNGDTVAFERVSALGDKMAFGSSERNKWEKRMNFLKNYMPQQAVTTTGAYENLVKVYKELVSIDKDRKATVENPISGMSELRDKIVDSKIAIMELNKKGKLKPETMEQAKKIIDQINEIGKENMDLFISDMDDIVQAARTFSIKYENGREMQYSLKNLKEFEDQDKMIQKLLETHGSEVIGMIADLKQGKDIPFELEKSRKVLFNSIRTIAHPELFDPISKEPVKEGTIIMINNKQAKFMGYTDKLGLAPRFDFVM